MPVPFVGGLWPHDMCNPDIDGLMGGKRRHPVRQDRLLHDRVVAAAVGMHLPVEEKEVSGNSRGRNGIIKMDDAIMEQS